jgi:hypothetical protein
MAQKSSIETLPPDILEQLQALLRDPRVTQLEAVAHINAIIEAQAAGDEWPAEIVSAVLAQIEDARVSESVAASSIRSILDWVGGASRKVEKISKSALNRYSQRMEQVGAKLRQGREIAQMWIGQLGNAPQGQLGQLVNELVRNLAFEAALHYAEGDEPIPPKALRELAIAAERLEKAASENEARQQKIEAEARRRALEEAAQRVGDAAKAKGLDEDQARFWREKVLMGV